MKTDLRYKPVEKLMSEIGEEKPVGTIRSMPYTTLVIVGIIALLLIISKNLVAIIAAVFLIICVIIILALVKNTKVLEIFKEKCIVFNPKTDVEGFIVYYEDVVEWAARNNRENDLIVFTLADESNVKITTNYLGKADRLLNKVMKEKERMHIHLNTIKQEDNLGKRASKLMGTFFKQRTDGGEKEARVRETDADDSTINKLEQLKAELRELEAKVNAQKAEDNSKENNSEEEEKPAE